MNPPLARVIAWITGLFLSVSCLASEPDLSTRTTTYNISYTLNQDGSAITKWHEELKILKEQALADAKNFPISYSKSRQTLEILSAYTLKADGRRIEVPQSNFQLQENGSKDATTLAAISDRSVMHIIFPDVEVGDSTIFTVQLIDIAPLYPNHFSTILTFPKRYAYDNVQILIDIPANMWFQYQANGLKEISNTEQNGRKLLAWTYQNSNPTKNTRTDYSVYELEQEPNLLFSTFKDYTEIAKAYAARAKVNLTPRIQQLADQLTQNKKTPTEIARALYEWVATHITYIQNEVGIGAVVPRNLEFVIDNRMGDCKDQAVLLQTLLAAKGIRSTQVLINSSEEYQLPKIAVPFVFDHVIVYIPSLDVYLDPTSDSTPFGMLPYGDQDKPVLWIDGYRAGTKTPAFDWKNNQSITKTDITIQRDGSLKGKAWISLKGEIAVETRAYFRNTQKDYETHLIADLFENQGYTGAGTLIKEDATALLPSYQYQTEFTLDNMTPAPGPGGLTIEAFATFIPTIAQTISTNGRIHEGNQPFDYACSGGEFIEEYTYHFPKGTRILAIPKNMDYANQHSNYRARYKKLGNTIYAIYHFTIRNGDTNVCHAHRRIWNQTAAKKLLPNLKAQIVYQMPESQ